MREGHVDALRLMIVPLMRGGGKPVFPDAGAQRTLELVSTPSQATGVHVCTDRPAIGAAPSLPGRERTYETELS
ncbi:hypothetical protein [Rhodococcus koreensis]|uniref:hypothetical protein n=1 Tax=Rhodococcus koreensis TaxID=99653 RepID=UPI00366B6FDF